MTLSAAELALVAAELGPALSGGHVQKVAFAEPRVAFLEIRVPGRSVLLRLDVTPGAGHLGVVESRPPSPLRPLAIQGLWRSHLLGARVDRVFSEGRTLTVDLSTDDGARSIVLALEGRGGALVLLDAARLVLGVTPPDRGLPRGTPWPAPPATEDRGGNRLATIAPDSQSMAVARETARLYAAATGGARLSQTRGTVLSALQGAGRKLRRTIGKVEEDRRRIEESTRYQHYGDLLKPMLSRLKRGDASATVTAWGPEGAQQVVVPLLPNLGPRENMERYYHLHRRLSRSAGRVDERLRLLRSQLDQLDQLIATAEAEENPARLAAMLEEARRDGLLSENAPSRSGSPERSERLPYREFISASGQRIWVGRNARDNDTLTLRYARGNDLWLHARGQTGSHVVVPGLGPQGTDGETLLDAAELAAHFSAGRGETLVEVAATKCKYVRKAKGSAPGAVTFSQEKTIQLRRQPERLARLLEGERRGTTSG